jgi:ketosteroid isomerase-like protein
VPKPQPEVDQRTARDICLAIVRSYRPECLDELLELLAPDIEWTTTETWIERETWHGHEGVRAGLERFFAEWSEFSHELEELRERGDRFAVATRMRGVHRRTGIATEMRTAGVCEVRDGLVTRIVGYSDPALAMRALEAGARPPRG